MARKPKKRPKMIDSSERVKAEADQVLEVKEVAPLEPAEEISPPESAPQQDQGDELPYTTDWWKGIKQWKCKRCPWDTLESEAAMLEHIAVVHAPPKPRILIADKSGRQIN